MSAISQIERLSAAEILKPSLRFPVTLQNETFHPFGGLNFTRFEDALRHHVYDTPGIPGKIEVPLELPMEAIYRRDDPESTYRSSDDLRVILSDREIALGKARNCTAIPYLLYNGIVSVVLDVEPFDEPATDYYDGFWLNILENGQEQPFSGVTDAYLQVWVTQDDRPPHETIGKYEAMMKRAGVVLENAFNTVEID